METRTLTWMGLGYLQALDVMRAAVSLTVAVSGEDGPYLAEMHFQLEMDGVQPVLHLSTRKEGRLARCLREKSRMSALIRSEHCTGVDTVLAEGSVTLTESEGGLRLMLRVEALSARRWFSS